jgi:elongation factor Ts
MFKELASRASHTALSTLKEDGGSIVSPLFSLKPGAVSQPEGDVKGLGESQLSAAAGSSASAMAATGINTNSPVSTVLLELIGKIRENMVLRRVGALILPKPAKPTESIALVSQYIHNSAGPGLGSIGVLLGLVANGKPEAIAKPETKAALKDLGKKLAMHVAGAKPLYASRDSVPKEDLEKERNILRSQAAASGKPANIIDKMVEGRLSKYYGETVLLDQPYVLSEEGASVKKVLDEQAKKLGLTSITVPDFLHYVVGTSPAAAKEAAEAAQKEAAGEMK